MVGRTNPLYLQVRTISATSKAVKLEMPKRTNLPALWRSLMARRVSAKGVARSCSVVRRDVVGTSWSQTYSGMQIQDIHGLGAQLLQADVQRRQHFVVRVVPGLRGVLDLARQGQAAVLPTSLAREGLLLAADVDACRVDLVVAARLEQIENLAELADVGDAGARRLIRAKGHQAQDDAWLGGLGDEGRHCVNSGFESGVTFKDRVSLGGRV